MPVRVGTESAPCSPAVIPAGSAAAGSTTVIPGGGPEMPRSAAGFLPVDGAGGVHQPAARFQQLCRRIEDGRLRGQ